MRGLLRFVCLLLVAASVLAPSPARAAKVRIRGGSVIDLRVYQRPGELAVQGLITDDVGGTLGRVTVRVEGGAALGAPEPCALGESAGSARADGRGWAIVTDERGQFCARVRGAAAGPFRASFVGNNLFEGSATEAQPIPETEQRATTVLRFESPPAFVDLDKEAFPVIVALRVDRADAQRLFVQGATRREGKRIELVDERGEQLAEATTGGDGRARFDVKSAALAGPGDGELRARFAGDAQLAPSTTAAFVTRTALATLEADEGARGDPDEGIAVDVRVATVRGAVDGGIVEAELRGERVGAASVVDGRARLLVTFGSSVEGEVPVSLRYVPAGPHHRAGPTVETRIAVVGPSRIGQVGLAIAGLALAAWIVAKWRRAPKVERRDSMEPPPPSGRPEILVVERPTGQRGWRGLVTDAHDGSPVPADLVVVVPSFEGRRELVRTRTDAAGHFAFDVDAPREARLIVDGELHATYEQNLPPPSVLRVALVTRRRALLDGLVRWAKRRGAPFDGAREPTPGHVRRAAARAGVGRVEAWAEQVERAAFGPEPVTRVVESEIAGAEPGASPSAAPIPAHEVRR